MFCQGRKRSLEVVASFGVTAPPVVERASVGRKTKPSHRAINAESNTFQLVTFQEITENRKAEASKDLEKRNSSQQTCLEQTLSIDPLSSALTLYI